MPSSEEGFNFGKFFGELLKEEISKPKPKEGPKPKTLLGEETPEDLAVKVQREEEMARRWYLNKAITLMSDEKTSEGMNYSWMDLVILSEKIRAYVEAGAYIDNGVAWQNTPKDTESPSETLGS